MKILLLSFYYRPDLCAGSFRASALVDALIRQFDEGTTIDVMTTMPNRYSSFEKEAEEYETRHSQVNIHRIPLPVHKSGMVDQSLAFLAFARAVLARVKFQEYSFVIATSSRLMTAALGAYIAHKQKAGLYLDIRDIFVDTLDDVMSGKAALFLKPFFSMVERFTVTRAEKVNLVSQGFSSYFHDRYPDQHYSFFTNGIDTEFIEAVGNGKDAVPGSGNDVMTVVYAGNMGDGQGLHAIIPELAKQLERKVKFRLIGDGSRRALLEQNLTAAGCRNVELLLPVPRDRLIAEYQHANVLFLHLNNYRSFEKVLPSKLFEYGALGKPVWAGVSGYAAEFVTTEIDNAAVFRPCDVSGAVSALGTLKLSNVSREAFVRKFLRTSIMSAMAADIMNVVRKPSVVT